MDIEAKKIGMTYFDAGQPVEVFRNLSLHVKSGASLAIVGQSGVGKTTLLNILGALENPVSGDIFWGKENISERARSRKDVSALRGKQVGYIFQFHHLLAEFDAVENVAMPLLIAGVGKAEARERATKLLTRVGLGHRLTHRPSALSGGEQQRVAIGRALVANPGVILADEPTGNLDHQTGGDVSKLLLEVQKELGVTLIIVTHSLELAMRMDGVVELTASGVHSR